MVDSRRVGSHMDEVSPDKGTWIRGVFYRAHQIEMALQCAEFVKENEIDPYMRQCAEENLDYEDFENNEHIYLTALVALGEL